MNGSIFIFLLLITAIIFYQDMQARSVYWWLFPLLAATGLANARTGREPWLETLVHIAINSTFLTVQFGLLYLFYSIRNKGRAGRMDKKIGWGDLLFLFSCCFIFSPVNFLCFYCGSLLFSLLAHLLLRLLISERSYSHTIPLAGWQALFLTGIAGFYRWQDIHLTDDHWLLMQLQTL